MNRGELHWADLSTGRRPVLVISEERFNRGGSVLVVLLTSTGLSVRTRLANCVPFAAGEFGLTRECVAQCESLVQLPKSSIDPDGPIGELDDDRMRAVVRAIGTVIGAECEPV